MTPTTTPVLLDLAIQVMILGVAGLFFLNGHWIIGAFVVLQSAATCYLLHKDRAQERMKAHVSAS